MSVSLSSPVVEIGGTTTATASVLDANNIAIPGKTISWATDNPLVSTVSSAGVVLGVGNGTANISATVDGKQGQAQATVVTSSKWVIDATVLTNKDYGGAAGALADVAVVRLLDGRYRMWMGAIPGTEIGIFSAISTDGIHFTPEPGIRIPVGQMNGFEFRISHPFVMRLDDGRLRLFAHGPSTAADSGVAIFSYTSSDEGMTFTLDPGKRLTAAAAGMTMFNLVGSTIVKVKSGGWRMYYSSANPMTLTTPGVDLVKSAFSSDLVTWTPDPGVRIGAGATLTGSAVHPGAIANDDGSVTLVYTRLIDLFTIATYISTSPDGLSFTTETNPGFLASPTTPGSISSGPAADPFLLRLPNGDVRMFYNWGDDKVGNIYVAHRSGFTLNGK